jgi:site-specific recombinase XerD
MLGKEETSMNEFVFDPQTLLRLHEGPLGFCIDSYLELLQEEGYTRRSIEVPILLVADFSGWLDENGYGAEDVSSEKVDRFLKCRYQRLRPRKGDSASLDRLIDLLCRMRVISSQTLPTIMTPCDRLLNDFRLYLAQDRGLSMGTLRNYLFFTSQFLCECLTSDRIDLSHLCAQDVTGFVRRHAQDHSRKRAKVMTTALRSFLRYLRYRGDLATDLAACVPAVACWSLSEVPKFLEPRQVQRVLECCNRQTTIGLRDYAILLLLARLGLRASEVAFLKLEDMDWEAGQITVHGKGGYSAHLPLPVDVGEAIADYLQKGRPSCSSRSVFVRALAPQRGSLDPRTISSIVRHAVVRAGIDSQHKGAHLFRHSLATQMLRKGASLAEIGEILRHRSANTTALYAKVDLTALRTLALPWPGGDL